MNTSPCSKTRRLQPKDNWIIIEDQHPAIISREIYDKAQLIFDKNQMSEKKPHDYPLKGLVRCGSCGRIMKRRVKGYGYICRFRDDAPEGSECIDIHFETEERLEGIVYNAIQTYVTSLISDSRNTKALREKHSAKIQALLDQLSILQKREEHIRADKLRQYEEYVNGSVEKAAYLRNKCSADEQLTVIREEISQIESQMVEMEQAFQHGESDRVKNAQRFQGQDKLSNEMATAFVEAVYIQPDDYIRIKWKFGDGIR